MRAFHVIGIDLQLGLGRDTRRLAQQDVAVLLLRIGALGVGRHIDQPAELPYGRTARDTFYIRVAAAVGHDVVRPQPDDAMLLPGGEERSAQQAFGTRPVEIDRIGGIGARKLHRRDMAKTAGSLFHGHLRKGFGNE